MDINVIKNIKKSLFTISIIVAVFFTLEIIGKKILLPFPSKLEFSNLTSADIINDKEYLIVDKQGSELIFLNERKEVKNVINLGRADKLSRINDITHDNHYFYVLGDKLFRNSAHIEYERVIRYTLDGKNPTVIFELKREKRSYVRSIKNINVVNNILYLTKIDNIEDNEKSIVKVHKIDLKDKSFKNVEIMSEKAPYAFDVKYLYDENLLFVSDYFGHLYSIKNGDIKYLDFTKYKAAYLFMPIDKDTCIWLDSTETNIFINEKVVLNDIITTYFNKSNNYLIYDNQKDSTLNVYDINKNENIEYKYVNYSPGFFILILLKFLSVIYLVVLIICLLLNALYNKYKEKDFSYLKKLGLISVATIVIIFISIFYEGKHIESCIELLKNDVKIMNSFFAKTINKNSFDGIDLTKNETFYGENIKEKNEFNDYYGLWAKLCNEYDNYAYVALYKKCNDKLILLYNSTGLTQYNIELKESHFSDNSNTIADVQIFSFASIKSYYLTEDIKDDSGKSIGLVEIGIDYDSFNKQAITECFEMSMALLIIFVVIFLLIVEGMALAKSFREKRNRVTANIESSEIYFMHSLTFFQSLVKSFDAIILVLITKDMVKALAYPAELENYLITLPMLIVGLGSIIGPILYIFIAKRVDARKSLISCSIIIVFTYVAITYAVYINNFILFCLAMFLLSIANVIVYTGISIIPYRTNDESLRFTATHEKNIGKVSASIFGTLIGGVIAQYLGNVSLYIANTISCIPIVILLFIVLPKNTFYMKREKNVKVATVANNYLKYIFSVPMISFIIFVLGPVMIAGGYRTYVFPLFTEALNMPKMYITNFYVFARVIMMILSGPIVKLTKKIDYWNLTIYCIIAIGLSFMTFGINTTVVWAIIMLTINSILDKIALPTKAMLWPRQAEVFGLDVAETQTLMTLLEKVVFSFKEIAFAVLLAFGDSKGCVIFGVIALICALLFAILTKNSPMAKKQFAKS